MWHQSVKVVTETLTEPFLHFWTYSTFKCALKISVAFLPYGQFPSNMDIYLLFLTKKHLGHMQITSKLK